MTQEPERGSIQPEDWPLEQTSSDENSAGLRSDIGVSSGQQQAGEQEPAGAGRDGDRGELGSTTPGESGTDEDPPLVDRA